MSCLEFDALLDPYFDGELPIPEVLATERHLSECAVCRGRYEGLEWLRAEIKAAHLDYVPSRALTQKVRALGARDAGTRAGRGGGEPGCSPPHSRQSSLRHACGYSPTAPDARSSIHTFGPFFHRASSTSRVPTGTPSNRGFRAGSAFRQTFRTFRRRGSCSWAAGSRSSTSDAWPPSSTSAANM